MSPDVRLRYYNRVRYATGVCVCVCTWPTSGKIAEEGPAVHAEFCAISASGVKGLGSFLAAATDFPRKGTRACLEKVTKMHQQQKTHTAKSA